MNELIDTKEWKLTKKILPQHTDHAGVMWHGTYFNFLEEGRIDAFDKVGITYAKLSEKGFEIPLISAQINYKLSFVHGEKVLLKSQFKLVNKIRLNCKSSFVKENGDVGSEALLELVLVRKKNDSMKLVRVIPPEIKKILFLLEKGPEI